MATLVLNKFEILRIKDTVGLLWAVLVLKKVFVLVESAVIGLRMVNRSWRSMVELCKEVMRGRRYGPSDRLELRVKEMVNSVAIHLGEMEEPFNVEEMQ